MLQGAVLSLRTLASHAMAFAMVITLTSNAAAERLLTPLAAEAAPGTPSSLRGVTGVQRLGLGHAALAALRAERATTVADFPLGSDRTADLLLTRFEPFSPGAHAEVMEAGGARRLALPDAVYFTGSVRGEPGSRALLIAAPDAVHGFVVSGGVVYPFGPDAGGGHRSYALRDVDAKVYPPPGDFCSNDYEPRMLDTPGVRAQALAEAGLAPPPVAPTTMKQADVAIETDRELRLKFASDQAALNYLASLAAAATAIYERDLNVRLSFSYIRLWGAAPADPWTASDTVGSLDEVQTYWTNPANNMDAIAGPHDTVHFISGKSVSGGVAYVNALCSSTYGFGVSQVFGSFDMSDPSNVWDVLVFTHELGHNFGSPHTHCYSPPIDKCYNAEPGCYSGAVVVSRGTIMSYCHLVGSGLSNIDMFFGNVVSARIATTVANAGCLSTVPTGTCGNAVLEPGEQCDDGNTVAGDGCSPSCHLEGCGNGIVDPGEQCDDGNTAGGDGCSATCQREPACGDGIVDPGEECDDGNTVGGDGCSGTCLREPCLVIKSAQTIWAIAKMSLRDPGTGRDRLSLRGDFGLPMSVTNLDPSATGVRLLVENNAGARKIDAKLPAGPDWVHRKSSWIYRDPAGATTGIRKLVIRDRTIGGVPDVQVTLAGRDGPYRVTVEDLPLVVTLILGDDAAGQAGACGRYAFGGGSCGSQHRGTRLVCR